MGGTDDAARGSAPTLEDAIALAASAHRGQGYPIAALRREPFILHPLRVLLRLATDEERTVAALHDVLEDTLSPSTNCAARATARPSSPPWTV